MKFLSRSNVLLGGVVVFSTSTLAETARATTPITVLSGFLGAGKTSFLTHCLNNRNSISYGLIVNDVAEVNVDSKLIRQQSSKGGVETVELQNGCVCCSLAEDLMASVSSLIQMADNKRSKYDHIVVECSGIAEPRKIRELFQEAEDFGSPLLRRVKLDTMATVVDAKVFLDMFGSDATLADNADLLVSERERESFAEVLDEQAGAGLRKVTELLLEQVECADVVIINKIDLLRSDRELEVVKRCVSSMNPTAKVICCVRGALDERLVIGAGRGDGAASWGMLDEHRLMVGAVEAEERRASDEHAHSHGHSEAECADPKCNDPTHDHSHSHGHSEAECADPKCNDPTHDHSHSHGHSEAECADPKCNDPTHDHSHSHGHTTAEERFGITSFIYRRRRPFNPLRLSKFLQSLGRISVNSVAEMSVAAATEGTQTPARKTSILRSKGFVWMATSAAAAYFISHAGQYLELVALGRWWADIPRDEWPQGAEADITVDFVGEYGDRRQEIVFIGQFDAQGPSSKKALEEVLDVCLLTDAEVSQYEQLAGEGDTALRNHFIKQ